MIGQVQRMTRRLLRAVPVALVALFGGAHGAELSVTDDEVELFRSFYQVSVDDFFEIVGAEPLELPMEEFEALPPDVVHSLCLATVDYMSYQSILYPAFDAAFGKPRTIEFLKRAKAAGGFLFKHMKAKLDLVSEKSRYCLLSEVVFLPGVGWLADGYAHTAIEFRLRDLYASQVLFIEWVWGLTPASSEHREHLETLIQHLERKYLLEIASP